MPRQTMPEEFSISYGADKLVVLARDPNWLYSYWELSAQTQEKIKGAKKNLRVYRALDTGKFFDIEIAGGAQSWYIRTDNPGTSWVVDFGIKLPDGNFVALMRSNSATTPPDSPSSVSDEEGLTRQEMFTRFYGAGFGSRPTSPFK